MTEDELSYEDRIRVVEESRGRGLPVRSDYLPELWPGPPADVLGLASS
ncbi:MAG: hypothetical protein JWM27_1333 [Gemmatimonadetes bacterium]|nr:hypothetical protein [Gemmatimonadota bacterium]